MRPDNNTGHCRLPIADGRFVRIAWLAFPKIGNWQSAIGNNLNGFKKLLDTLSRQAYSPSS
jgi:hypothetical protein